MPRNRLSAFWPALLLLGSLACEMLDNIQQDPSLVQNPDPPASANEAASANTEATLKAELAATATAIIREHDATRTAAVGTEQANQTSIAGSATPFATPTFTPIPNRPPVVTRFTANFVSDDRTTYYTIEIVDEDSQTLTYRWSNTNPCGTFNWDSAEFRSPEASWYHPHPPCPDERFHPAIVSVIVSDGDGNEIYFEYSGGSASGLVVAPPVP